MAASNTCIFVVVVLSVLCSSVNCFKISKNVDVNSENATYPYHNRAAWGAAESTDKRPLKTPVQYVVIHHTYIPGACFNFKDCSQSMRSMQRYHMSLKWGDIGYNFCVGTDGAAYEGRGWSTVGIHAGPANSVSVGICLIGDWRVELPPSEVLETTKALIADGVKKGIIKSDYSLIGHKQVMATECPGQALLDYVATWDHYVPGTVHIARQKS